ncbi:MAG TPA: hypothetical protein ENJ87_08305 [Gammaproteobacteria bacterium]|nr:hypothetical protein [Gammaproteobacteria bacterium]
MSDREQLLFRSDTRYGLVEVWQWGDQRWLNIDAIEQSRIILTQADQLLSPLHHAFLAVLLFIDTPEKILLAGMGGGALARYLHHVDPAIGGDAVEINKTVSRVAEQFFDFPEKKWSISIDDIQQWQGTAYSLIVADIAEKMLTPVWLTSEKTLLQLKQQLSDHGVLVMNLLVSDAQSFAQILFSIRKIFGHRTLCLTVPDHKNIVIFAFNQQPKYASSDMLSLRLKPLAGIWKLDFMSLLQRLKNDNPSGSGIF